MKATLQTILRVSNLERSADFYASLFDIKVRVRTDEWAELGVEGAKLLLVKTAEPENRFAATVPTAPSACYLGVETDDLDAFHAKTVALRTRCIQPPRKQPTGDRIAVYNSPDGLMLQVTEFDKFGI